MLENPSFFCYFFTRLLKVGEDAVSSEGVFFFGGFGIKLRARAS